MYAKNFLLMTNGVTVTTDRSLTIMADHIHINEKRKCANCGEDAKTDWKSNQRYCEKKDCKKARDKKAKETREDKEK